MPIDISSLKKKLNSLSGQNSRKEALWKPTPGKTVIRLVPYNKNPDNPFIEAHFHYLNNKTYLSPITFGRPDPFVEFANKLQSTGERDDWMAAKAFMPKARTYVPVVERGKEHEGVKFFSFGKTVYKELLAIIADEDYGDITDPKTGRDITVEYIDQKNSDTGFAKTTIRPKANASKLTEDQKLLESLLENQPDFNELYEEYTYDQLKSVLENYLDPSATPAVPQRPQQKDEDEAIENVTTPSPTASKSATSTTTVKTVADEFSALFDN